MTELERRGTDSILSRREFYRNEIPAFDELRTDAAGRLWVRRYQIDSDAPRSWIVFGRQGELLGTVTTPGGLVILQIGADYVLGTRRAGDYERPYHQLLVHRLLPSG